MNKNQQIQKMKEKLKNRNAVIKFMLKITTSFSPIRMIAGQKEPVILNVYVKNNSETSKMATVFVKIPYSLGFDKIGLERDLRRRIANIKSGAEKTVPILIYGKSTISEGEYPVSIKVYMHSERYDKSENDYSLETKLRVVK